VVYEQSAPVVAYAPPPPVVYAPAYAYGPRVVFGGYYGPRYYHPGYYGYYHHPYWR